ncbi:hypothetical protein ANTRET_LOCUS923 [Anthophora retusa]
MTKLEKKYDDNVLLKMHGIDLLLQLFSLLFFLESFQPPYVAPGPEIKVSLCHVIYTREHVRGFDEGNMRTKTWRISLCARGRLKKGGQKSRTRSKKKKKCTKEKKKIEAKKKKQKTKKGKTVSKYSECTCTNFIFFNVKFANVAREKLRLVVARVSRIPTIEYFSETSRWKQEEIMTEERNRVEETLCTRSIQSTRYIRKRTKLQQQFKPITHVCRTSTLSEEIRSQDRTCTPIECVLIRSEETSTICHEKLKFSGKRCCDRCGSLLHGSRFVHSEGYPGKLEKSLSSRRRWARHRHKESSNFIIQMSIVP